MNVISSELLKDYINKKMNKVVSEEKYHVYDNILGNNVRIRAINVNILQVKKVRSYILESFDNSICFAVRQINENIDRKIY